MELTLIKTASGTLAPYGQEASEKLTKVKVGRILNAKVTQPRNPMFHRKVFALYGISYDHWAETMPKQQYKGQDVEPLFDRHRKDLTILAGYYTPVFDLEGGLHLEAQSISFANMDQETFEALFSKLINVVLTKVLTRTGMTEQQLRDAVDEVLRFDS